MLNSTRIRVSGMDSARAIRAVSDALVDIQGVADVGVNAEQGLIEVKFDPEKTNEGAIRSAVQQSGVNPQ